MRNTGLDEAQAGIKIARRNINNLNQVSNPNLKKKITSLSQYFQKSPRLILIGPAESHAQEHRPF